MPPPRLGAAAWRMSSLEKKNVFFSATYMMSLLKNKNRI